MKAEDKRPQERDEGHWYTEQVCSNIATVHSELYKQSTKNNYFLSPLEHYQIFVTLLSHNQIVNTFELSILKVTYFGQNVRKKGTFITWRY